MTETPEQCLKGGLHDGYSKGCAEADMFTLAECELPSRVTIEVESARGIKFCWVPVGGADYCEDGFAAVDATATKDGIGGCEAGHDVCRAIEAEQFVDGGPCASGVITETLGGNRLGRQRGDGVADGAGCGVGANGSDVGEDGYRFIGGDCAGAGGSVESRQDAAFRGGAGGGR